jgi:hypothetical protein
MTKTTQKKYKHGFSHGENLVPFHFHRSLQILCQLLYQITTSLLSTFYIVKHTRNNFRQLIREKK